MNPIAWRRVTSMPIREGSRNSPRSVANSPETCPGPISEGDSSGVSHFWWAFSVEVVAFLPDKENLEYCYEVVV